MLGKDEDEEAHTFLFVLVLISAPVAPIVWGVAFEIAAETGGGGAAGTAEAEVATTLLGGRGEPGAVAALATEEAVTVEAGVAVCVAVGTSICMGEGDVRSAPSARPVAPTSTRRRLPDGGVTSISE